MKILSKYLILLLALFLLNGCQNVKDGLTGKKKNNSDEFLVEKKNPLVLPPEFEKLPEPKSSSANDENEEEIDLISILGKTTDSKEQVINTESSSGTLENSIIEKIKKN